MTTENNVAAQAGDEPMRLVSANLLDRAVALLQSSGQMGVAHQLKECVSPRAITAVTEALQVCVKALEFRKERSANDEFALNLARIALAGSPRATADVEREKLAMECMQAVAHNFTTYDEGDDETSCRSCSALIPENGVAQHHPDCLVPRARAAIATTKLGA